MKTVEIDFKSQGLKLSGSLYLPETEEAISGRPTIISCSGYQGFNSFYPRLFAKSLTEAGFVCIGFDYRGFADSEGEEGRVVLEEQVEDVLSALAFSRKREEVSPEQVALLGWGMGCSNALRAAGGDKNVKAVAVLNGFYDGERWLRSLLDREAFIQMVQEVEEDVAQRKKSGRSRSVPTFHHYPLDPDTKEHVNVELVNLHNFGKPVQLLLSESLLRLHQNELVSELLSTAVLVAHGERNKLHPPSESKALYDALTAEKHYFSIDGAHNDFMYEDNPVFSALMKEVSSFFKNTL